jgi:hypothetical protein
MKKINTYKRNALGILFSFLLFGSFGIARAQEAIVPEVIQAQEVETIFQPTIQSVNSVELGKNIIFRADVSSLPEEGQIRSFLWEFGNGQFNSQEEVAHIFNSSGRYNVRLKVTWLPPGATNTEVAEITKEIFVFERALFLLTETTQRNNDRIQSLQQRAEDQGVYLHSVQLEPNGRFRADDLKKIEQSLPEIQSSQAIIVWSDSVELFSFLNSFSNRVQLQDKDFVVISEGNIGLLKNILLGTFQVLSPKRIILTRREALDEFFTTKDGDVLEVIRNRGYDFDVLDQAAVDDFNFFSLPSYGMSYLQERGVEDSVLLMILFLPVVVTLVTFLRLVIGLSTLGGRLPIIFTYTFLVLGWWLGFVSILILAFISTVFRIFFFKSHLLYTAKVGILTSTLGLVLLFLLAGILHFNGGHFDFPSALILVLLASMIDRVGGVEGESGYWPLVRVFVETLLISSLGFLLISWEWMQILLLSHPELILLFIIANIVMGRFTGLRLMEYFRFREVLKFTEEE